MHPAMKCAESVGRLVFLMSAAAGPLAAQAHLERPRIGTPTVVGTGPAWLQAAGDIPGLNTLRWPPAPNAINYLVRRSMDGVGFYPVFEVLPSAGNQDPQTGNYSATDAGIFLSANYWYQIVAVFSRGVNPGSSPVASVTSAPYFAATGLRFTVLPSTAKLGQLRATLSWNPVRGAADYTVTFTLAGNVVPSIDVTQTSLVIDDAAATFPTGSGALRFRLLPTQKLGACVTANYHHRIMGNPVAACTTIQL